MTSRLALLRQGLSAAEALLDQFIHLVAKHPQTTFIGAHFGNNAEDVATVARWLDKYPNLVIDIDARISELGRQPYTARKFLIKYQDRVMFGTDTTCRRESYRTYYRFLETDDEYFDCAASHHLQGFWMIYGVFLPKDVLEKIYLKNASGCCTSATTSSRARRRSRIGWVASWMGSCLVSAPALAVQPDSPSNELDGVLGCMQQNEKPGCRHPQAGTRSKLGKAGHPRGSRQPVEFQVSGVSGLSSNP